MSFPCCPSLPCIAFSWPCQVLILPVCFLGPIPPPKVVVRSPTANNNTHINTALRRWPMIWTKILGFGHPAPSSSTTDQLKDQLQFQALSPTNAVATRRCQTCCPVCAVQRNTPSLEDSALCQLKPYQLTFSEPATSNSHYSTIYQLHTHQLPRALPLLLDFVFCLSGYLLPIPFLLVSINSTVPWPGRYVPAVLLTRDSQFQSHLQLQQPPPPLESFTTLHRIAYGRRPQAALPCPALLSRVPPLFMAKSSG